MGPGSRKRKLPSSTITRSSSPTHQAGLRSRCTMFTTKVGVLLLALLCSESWCYVRIQPGPPSSIRKGIIGRQVSVVELHAQKKSHRRARITDSRQRNKGTNFSKMISNGKEKKFRRGVSFSLAHLFNRSLQSILRSGGSSDGGRSVVQQAHHLLMQKVELPYDGSYDTVSFNLVLQGWARQNSLASAQRADNLLSVLLRLSSTLKAPYTPDAYSYAAVLHAYAKSGGKLRAALRANELLEQLIHSNRRLDTDVCHNAVINAWAASGDPRAGSRAEQILRRLLGSTDIQPTLISFNACIKAYAKSGQPDHAQRLLDELKKMSGKRPELAPDKISYSSCIDAWSRSCTSSVSAAMAEGLLREMEAAFEVTGDENIRPDIVAYTSVLAAYAKSGAAIGNDKVIELLDRLQRYAQQTPNAPFLNAWIHLLAKTSTLDPMAPHDREAESILAFMRAEYATGEADLKPCKITFTAVISVLAQVGTVAAAERASQLLDELQALWEATGDVDFLPNAKTFASVLNAWAKVGARITVDRADKLIERMEELYERTKSDDLKPNLIVFFQAFQVFANSRERHAATRAKDLLHKMKFLYLSGYPEVRPDATTYAYLVNAFTKLKVDNVAELASMVLEEAEAGYSAGIGGLRPTPLLYSAVLQAYAKSSSREGAEMAETLLGRTKEMYKQGKLYAKPTALFYNAVIDAHARSGSGREAAERAEQLLDEMEAVSRAGDSALSPTTRSFNAAILAWKNSNSTEAPRRAEALLKRMNSKWKAGDRNCRPDRVSLNSVIAVWANSRDEDAPERVEQYLHFMESSCAKGLVSLKPDAWTYNTLIKAYAVSTRSDATLRAQRLYERMKRLYDSGDDDVRPALIKFTSLGAVWTQSRAASNGKATSQMRRTETEIPGINGRVNQSTR